MERALQKVFATLSWCALIAISIPARVEAHSGCQAIKVSNGNLVQRGGGNSYDTTGTGGFGGEVWVNGAAGTQILVSHPTLTTPPEISEFNITLEYDVFLNGVLYGSYSKDELTNNPVYITKPTNGRDVINVGLDLFEKSGTGSDISQYRVTIDISC